MPENAASATETRANGIVGRIPDEKGSQETARSGDMPELWRNLYVRSASIHLSALRRNEPLDFMPSPYELRTKWFEDCKHVIRCAKCGKVVVEVRGAAICSLKVVCESCSGFTRRDSEKKQ